MAHGIKPYGRTQAQNTIFAVQDMGELAARLWSPNIFNRLGNVIFMDSFEGSLNKWVAFTDGAGAAVAVTNHEARTGAVSCLLTGGTTLTRIAQIGHFGAYPVLSRFGLEFSFCLRNVAGALEFYFDLYDGANWTAFHIRWDNATNILSYIDHMGGWVQLAAGVDFQGVTTLFHTAKLVIDGINGQYAYLIIDGIAYPMTGLLPSVAGVAGTPYYHLIIRNEGLATHHVEIAIDDVIVTQNEP